MSIGPIGGGNTAAFLAQVQQANKSNATEAASGPKEGAAITDKFAQTLAEGISAADGTLKEADASVEQMVESNGANLHETMIALEKADIAARLTIKIGTKLVQAYREVSQMQV